MRRGILYAIIVCNIGWAAIFAVLLWFCTGCASITEIGIGPSGLTFRFKLSAEQDRTGQDWLRFRERRAEREARLDAEVMGPVMEADDEG